MEPKQLRFRSILLDEGDPCPLACIVHCHVVNFRTWRPEFLGKRVQHFGWNLQDMGLTDDSVRDGGDDGDLYEVDDAGGEW